MLFLIVPGKILLKYQDKCCIISDLIYEDRDCDQSVVKVGSVLLKLNYLFFVCEGDCSNYTGSL